VEREEFWTDGWTAEPTDSRWTAAPSYPAADAQQPRSAADLELDAEVDEDAYQGAADYTYRDGYAANPRGMMGAATGHNRHADRGNQHRCFQNVRERMTFGDWTQEEWDRMERMEHDPPISVLNSSSGSSLPLLESVSPPPPLQHRNPSPPPSPEPLQIQYVPDGEAGPTYALQVGPSLWLQPLQQRLVLASQLRAALISGEEELMLDEQRDGYNLRPTVSTSSPSPPPLRTAVATTQFCSFWSSGRRGCRRRFAPSVLNARRRSRSTE
jgi:hypothetical protein